MADNNFKINIEIATVAAQKSVGKLEDTVVSFEKKTGKSTKGIREDFSKIEKSGKDASAGISIGFKQSIGALDVFKGSLAADFVAGAFQKMLSAASGLFRVLVVDGVAAAQVQEDAVNSLAVAMQTAGDFTNEALDDFKAFAQGIQANSKYGDEVILEQLALVKSYGATNEQAKLLTEASIELAAAQGKSVQETTRQVAKTLGGYAGELAEVFPAIKNLTAEQLKNAEVGKLLIAQYGGSAAGAIRTYSGALEQAKNRFGDFLETVGATITQNASVIATMNAVGAAFGKAKDGVDGNTEAYKVLVAEGLIFVIKTFADMVTAIDNVDRLIDVFVAGFLQQFAEMRLSGLKFLNVFSDQKNAIQLAESTVASYADSVNDAFTRTSSLENFATEIRTVQHAAEEALVGMKDGSVTASQAFNNVKEKVKELTAEQKLLQDQSKAFAKTLIDQSTNTEANYTRELELLRTNADLKIAQEEITKEQILSIEDQFLVDKNALLEQRKAEELAILERFKESDQVSEADYLTAKGQLQKNYETLVLKSEADLLKQKKKNDEEKKKTDAANQKVAIQGTADLFGQLSALSSTAGRKQFQTTKALSTAQAITQGILAVQQAYASAPPPFNIPAIAATTIATGLNISRIQSQQPPKFAQGGIVPGHSFSGDRVGALVNSGEMILNRQQQRQLFDVANGQGGGGQKLDQAINLLRQVVGQPISIQIDGREIVNVTRNQLQAGRTI